MAGALFTRQEDLPLVNLLTEWKPGRVAKYGGIPNHLSGESRMANGTTTPGAGLSSAGELSPDVLALLEARVPGIVS